MKEIPSLLDKGLAEAIGSLDKKSLDKILGNFQWLNCQFGPESGFKTAHARWWARKWLTNIQENEQTSFALYAPRLLEGFEVKTFGEENLKEESTIFVTNHPLGPISGYWICFALNKVIEDELGTGSAPYWLTKDYLTNAIFRNQSLSLLMKKWARIWADPGEVFILPADLREREKKIDQVADYLRENGRIAVTIKSPAGEELERARPGVGRILTQLTRDYNFSIQPVGLWKDNDDLNLRFGPKINLDDISDNQKIADQAAVHIARLLPEEKKGFYKNC